MTLIIITIALALATLAVIGLAQFPPAPDKADLNGDGKVNMIDYALFVKAYQESNGSIPASPPPNELMMLKMEVQLLREENASLDNELRLERGRNTVEINQYQQQLGFMLLNKFESMINSVRQPMNVYLYDVSGISGIHITFDDPNGVK